MQPNRDLLQWSYGHIAQVIDALAKDIHMHYNTTWSIFVISRPVMSITLGLTAVIGARIAGQPSNLQQILLFLLGYTIASGGFVANDITDRHRDVGAINKPIAAGHLSIRSAQCACAGLFLCGLALSLSQGWIVLLIVIAQLATLALYTRIKSASGLAANLATALMCASAFVIGSYAAGSISSGYFYALLALMIVLPREIIKDVQDVEVDKLHSVRTLPVILGPVRSAQIAITITGLALTLIAAKAIVDPSSFGWKMVAFTLVAASTVNLLETLGQRAISTYLNLTAIAFILYLGGSAT